MTSASDVLQMIKDNDVKFVDLRLTDTHGKEMHVTVPADCIDEDVFELGQPFDGSSFAGWRGIESSDMLLMPDPDSARMDPFREVNTLILQCNVHEPKTGKDYDRDPRSLGLRAEAYLKSTGIGDTAYFGPEPEFFIFDSVRWEHRMGKSFFESTAKKARGRPASRWKAAILATTTASRAATSRSRRSTPSPTCVPRCARSSTSRALTLKSITMRWAAPASAKSARASRRSCSAPTGRRS